MNMQILKQFDLGMNVGFVRSANIRLGDRDGMFFMYSDAAGTDPGEELLRFKDIGVVRLAVFDMDGRRLWEKILPDGVVSGVWFVPAVPFDMDGDGVDEIYFVNNTGAPFSFMHRKLECLNGLTGETLFTCPWPWNTFNERLSLCYRFYIVAGYAHGEPVLVTCQGTYTNMYLQGWNRNMSPRWEVTIKAEDPGPRASHMTPVIDINNDGVDELFWGERVLSLDDGHEVINYAPAYHGHSDVVIPFIDYKTEKWYVFTCREDEDPNGEKRVIVFHAGGSESWSAVDKGHMHTAWIANHPNGSKIAMAMRQHFVPDDSGFVHATDALFYFDAYTGAKKHVSFPCDGHHLFPIDVNGDGVHEFLIAYGESDTGDIINWNGDCLGHIDGGVFRMGKMINHPGEQIMTVMGGVVYIYGDADAKDGEIMVKRYSYPYLPFMQKLMATGYNSIGSQIACGV